MAHPYEFTLLASMTASASFTTSFASLNYQLASLHVVYGSMDTDTGSINISASNDLLARVGSSQAKWAPLKPAVTSLTSNYDSILFRIPDLDTAFVQFQYNANSNTTGTIAAYAVLKSYS